MPPRKTAQSKGYMTSHADPGRVECTWCTNMYLPRGIGAHERRCVLNPANSNHHTPEIDTEFVALAEQEGRNGKMLTMQSELLNNNIQTIIMRPVYYQKYQTFQIYSPKKCKRIPNQMSILSKLEVPRPNFKTYTLSITQAPKFRMQIILLTNTRPWRPFRTRLDFEFAEIFLSAHLSHDQLEVLIALIHQAIASPNEFTLKTDANLTQIWTFARETRAQGFIKTPISVDYKGESLTYNVWYRPLWEWCRELLLDPALVQRFHWNAEQLFMYKGERFERIIDEPWTANTWWDIQSRPDIPNDASLMFINPWADKSQLSSFGTVKGYPVMVRCANLPVDIRNGTGVGGGRLIGWLPIPDEDSAHTHKASYVDLKRLIWHKAVHKILQSIEAPATFGAAIKCGDGKIRNIFPHILSISADYEEQTMMALTRGRTGLFPCPICLVPNSKLSNISTVYPRRTTSQMRQIYIRSQSLNATESEELLKSYGITDVMNVFWDISRTDIYKALSFDVLHAYDGGLFKSHMLVELKAVLRDLGRDAEVGVDLGLQSIPPWPSLNHFDALNKTGEMSDGRKFEHLSKVIIFAAQHVLTAEASPRGYLLLRLIRSYLNLRMFASLTLQTETSISNGRKYLEIFSKTLQLYASESPEKSWNFPKAHTHQHIFDDILNKGVTRNYNTKPYEKANGPLKKFYQNHTNFKNVAPQILQVNKMDLVSNIVREGIDLLDVSMEKNTEDAEERDGLDLPAKSKPGNDHIHLGSKLPSITLSELELETIHSQDAAFNLFRRRLGQSLSQTVGSRVLLSTDHPITPYQSIEVFYESLIDWRVESNILRTNPKFHHKERYDFALIKVDQKQCIFVQLLYLFGIELHNQTYYMALALPMDVPRSLLARRRDIDLGLIRVRSRPRSSAVFIHADTIIWGALLSKNHSTDVTGLEFLVNDLIDQDMWERLNPDLGHVELINHANV
ncbi:hypothetical protein JR316_0000063 [Psilocybe cubensis]|uniref:Uncharacterized protein n=2 Tax=Psilocybe cubensis TaxID=181762 RepID=A0A8H7Y8S3_PSICU|nr:hypothetical protein JR316_0000063 [Psilocybe cubensis]KAH9486000.1 hypothetical protein JR316_0000063 [Psilocybe cubensis]